VNSIPTTAKNTIRPILDLDKPTLAVPFSMLSRPVSSQGFDVSLWCFNHHKDVPNTPIKKINTTVILLALDRDHFEPKNLQERQEHYSHRASGKRVEVRQNYHVQAAFEAFAILT